MCALWVLEFEALLPRSLTTMLKGDTVRGSEVKWGRWGLAGWLESNQPDADRQNNVLPSGLGSGLCFKLGPERRWLRVALLPVLGAPAWQLSCCGGFWQLT